MSRKTKVIQEKKKGAEKKKITQLDRIETLVTRQRENPSIDSTQLDRIEGMVNKQDESINGNGHEGLKTRTARIEENLESMALSIKGASDCAKDNAENLKKLTDLVTEHVKSVHLNNLLQKRWFWGLLVFGIVILNTASTYLPNLLNAFFTWAGIPFQLPLT
jgi:archaellum component FlaC